MLARSIVAALALASTAFGSYFVPVADKDVKQCSDLELSFKGKAPFTIEVWPGCDEDADADKALATYKTNSTSATWVVNVKSGKTVMFGVTDANGNEDFTDDYKVVGTNSTACLGKLASFSSPLEFGKANGTTTPTPSGGVNNAGNSPEPSNKPLGALGGAMSSFSVQSEVAVLAAIGTIVSAALF